MAGVDRQRLLVARERRLAAFKVAQRVAAVVEGLDIVGLDGQRPLIACERFLDAVEVVEGGAAVVQRLGIIRLDRQHPVVACERVLQAAKPGLHGCQQMKRDKVARVGTKNGPAKRFRLIHMSRLERSCGARERFGQRELHVAQLNRSRPSNDIGAARDRTPPMRWRAWGKRLAVAMLLPDLIRCGRMA